MKDEKENKFAPGKPTMGGEYGFGWSRTTGWLHGDEAGYLRALEAWKNRPINFQGQRRKPIHPSWEPFVKYFDPTNQERSQAAFCRWCTEQGEPISRTQLSAAKNKEITPRFVILLIKWRRKDEKEVEGE